MLFEWIVREGWIILSWWLLVSLAGLAVLPLLVRLLAGLPDKGYTLARAAGLLVVGFVFWLLASLGFVNNSPGSLLLAWLLVLVTALLLHARLGSPFDWGAWWRENRPVVIAGEALFFLLLLGWAIVRAHQNGVSGTEKPMELAFMSGVMRSETFPPHDPWLSGYSISYYYFGYVMSAALSMLSGIGSATGFNMTVALLFALTGLSSFGLVYNLVRSRGQHTPPFPPAEKPPARGVALLVGLVGMTFVIFLSNFHTVLIELPYRAVAVPQNYLEFFDAKDRGSYLTDSAGSIIQQPVDLFNMDANTATSTFWWWFDASRALNDRDLSGNRTEVIDEFPQFSFLLGDVHPHVLALPFAVLALGLALNVLLTGRPPAPLEIVLYAIVIGGLVFLNTWDAPIYAAILIGAEALRRQSSAGRLTRADWWALLRLGVTLAGLALLLYLPFLIGFRSQLGGVLPNLIYPTRIQQYFTMFGPFLVLLLPFVIVQIRRARGRFNGGLGLMVVLALLGTLLLALLGFMGLASLNPALRGAVLAWADQQGGIGAVLPQILARRLDPFYLLTTVVLLVLIALVVGLLFPRRERETFEQQTDAEAHNGLTRQQPAAQPVTYPPAAGFALLLLGAALMLSLVPEFVYLRDNFSTRMNTIFKFYYQAWLLFSIAAAYGVYTLLADRAEPLPLVPQRAAYAVVVVAVLTMGLIYPVLGIYHRIFIETRRAFTASPAALTLDGSTTLIGAGDDYAAIMCLNSAVQGDGWVIAEATSLDGRHRAYHGNYGRVATLTGIPNLLGWQNHQSQWRGVLYPQFVGTREADIMTLYTHPNWELAIGIIQRYSIDFIFVGATEAQEFGSNLAIGLQNFDTYLEPFCQYGSARVYRVPQALQSAERGG